MCSVLKTRLTARLLKKRWGCWMTSLVFIIHVPLHSFPQREFLIKATRNRSGAQPIWLTRRERGTRLPVGWRRRSALRNDETENPTPEAGN
jgi:hypothetical protein